MSQQFRGFAGTNRYVPTRLLGIGGMGAVYAALDRATGARVALKVMLAEDAARLLRFKQEFRVMAELHHPNLVRLFDLGQHEGQWFFTMELCHGQNLLEVLLHEEARAESMSTSTAAAVPDALASFDRPPEDGSDARERAPEKKGVACDPEALVRIVAQILDALEFLHARGIVHRDLKPSNILVDIDANVRVLDFGLASRLDRTEVISQDGAVVGTLAYLSPEQLRGEAASPASDMYALGCMMFQLLTGQLPFTSLTGRADRQPPRVDDRVADAPPALVDVIHRIMAPDPANRPAVAEVRAALGLTSGRRTAKSEDEESVTSEIFVGRQRELSVLAGCLDRAADGEMRLALVSGPSGIGKSALGSVIARRAERLGFLCFRGRCYEREQVPFVAFDRVMDAMTLTLRRWPPAHLAPLGPALTVLERIFPAIGMLTGDLDAGAGASQGEAEAVSGAEVDPRELHRQAFDGFRKLCAHCQSRAPLCIVLDDLQWADDESIALLEALLADGAGRILVLGLFRSDGAGANPTLDRLLRRADGGDHATMIRLDALGSADAFHLVNAVTAGRIEPALADALASQAEGNPFLVRRLAEHLATLAPADQTAGLDTFVSADDLIRRMIQGLSPRAEQALALAATAGGDIAASLLRATSGLGGEEFDLAVGELMAARFFKAVPPGPEVEAPDEALPRLDLYHDRIREVAYQGLDGTRRRALHRSLALAIEASPPGRGRDAEVLVRHWSGAGDRDRERRYAVEAAEQAAAKLAFLRAARLFRLVLDDPDPGADPLVTAARWERVGELFEYSGQHLEAARAYQEAQRRWDDMAEGHPDRGESRIRLRGLVGANLMAIGRIGEAREAFESGLALLGLPLERPTYHRIAVLVGLQCRTALAERLDDLGVPQRGGSSTTTEVRFLDHLVRAFQPLWPLPAAEAALRAELLGRRLDDKRLLHRSLAFGAAVPVLIGRCSPAQLDRAHQRLDMAEELARSHDLPLGRELVQINRSLLWAATNMERARRACDVAIAGFAHRGMAESFDGHIARIYKMFILVAKGSDDDALATIDHELLLDNPPFVNTALVLFQRVRLLARRGLCAEAREALARVRAHLDGAPPSRFDLSLIMTACWVLVAEGGFAEVLAAWEPAERAARESGAWAVGIDRTLWLEVYLEAALALVARRSLPASERSRARASARWLAERGVFDFGCVGLRALALLDHAEGHKRAAKAALRRALSLSSANTSPYNRWLCLEAARDMGAITLDQESEAKDLRAQGKYAPPLGRRATEEPPRTR